MLGILHLLNEAELSDLRGLVRCKVASRLVSVPLDDSREAIADQALEVWAIVTKAIRRQSNRIGYLPGDERDD